MSNMSELYDDYDSNDDMAENDDDIGALGSILSWDDEEEAARTSLPLNMTKNDRESSSGSLVHPPEMVQFNSNGEFNFLQFTDLNPLRSSSSPSPAPVPLQKITLQIPVSAMGPPETRPMTTTEGQGQPLARQSVLTEANNPTITEQSQQQQVLQQQRQQQQQQQQTQLSQQHQQQQQQQQHQATFALSQGPLVTQIAQLLAAQHAASNLMQHQCQQQGGTVNATNAMQPPQSQPQPTAAHFTQQAVLQLQRALQAQQQSQQQQQQQQQNQMTAEHQRQFSQLQASVSQVQQQAPQQQQQQQPIHLSSDPSTLLQQIQFAQLQQQFHAAQQAQAANSQSMSAAPTTTQMQAPTSQSLISGHNIVATSSSTTPQGSATMPLAQNNAQQQLQMHFSRAQKEQQQYLATSIPPVLPRSSATPLVSSKPVKSSSSKSQSNTKKKTPHTTSNNSSARSSALETTASASGAATASGLVTASDTDGEMSRKTKKTKSFSSESFLFDFDEEDDDDDDEADGLLVESKAKSNRDRNREHARNTRLRKKAYLEKLQATVDELGRERDTLVSERTGAASLLVEMHNTRTEVLMSLFALRSTNEKRRELWSSILDESCATCVMPVTPYRSFPASEVQVSKCQRTIMGIDGMIADTASFHVMFDALVDRSLYPLGKIEFRYTLITEEAVVAGNQMMARWVMSTLNAVQCGAKMEVAKQGMLCCRFNSNHKIIGLELMFDVMAFMLQLKQAAGTEAFSVIPNTVQTCQRAFDKAVVMTLAESPYTIVQVNKQWEQMTGYSAEEVVDKASIGILQGASTDRRSFDEMMREIRFKRPAFAILSNTKKSGELFRNFLLLFPLSTDSRISHYLAVTDFADSNCGINPRMGKMSGFAVQKQHPVGGPSVSVAAPLTSQAQPNINQVNFNLSSPSVPSLTAPVASSNHPSSLTITDAEVGGSFLPPQPLSSTCNQDSLKRPFGTG